MKRRVIPSEARDLPQKGRSRSFEYVVQAAWARSFASLRMTAYKIGHYKKLLLAFAILVAVVALVWIALPKPPLLDGISFSQCVRDRNGKLLRVTLTTDQKFRVWTSLPNISPALIDATLQFEDKYYRHHPGVNPVALVRAAFGLRPGGVHSGASTITMQLARLRYHLTTRTLRGKLIQIIRALELERHYSKDEILESCTLRTKHRRRGRGQPDLFRQDRSAFDKTGIHFAECHSTKPDPTRVV